MGRPRPAQLYEADDLQTAYESGFQQMHDHDSFGFLDRLDAMADSLSDDEAPRAEAELRAAAIEGAAAALRALAARTWEGARWE
jgi:hypothetical protein